MLRPLSVQGATALIQRSDSQLVDVTAEDFEYESDQFIMGLGVRVLCRL